MDGQPGASAGRKAISISVAVAAVAVAVALGMVSANGSASRSIALNAQKSLWTNSSMGSAALARAAVSQAVVFGVDRSLGVASDEAVEVAMIEARAAVEAAVATIGDADTAEDQANLAYLSGVAIDTWTEILDFIDAGEVAAAVELRTGGAEADYDALRSALAVERQRNEDQIRSNEASLGRAASLARGVVTLLIPITALCLYWFIARKQVRRNKDEMESRLRLEQDLNRAKDELIAGVSHELRTPLTSIVGFAEILSEREDADPLDRELNSLIHTEATELSRMVEDLLIAARLDAGAITIQTSEVSLDPELASVVGTFTRRGHQIELETSGVWAEVDALRFRQIIRNLLSNAVKHGGDQIRVEAARRGPWAVIAVVDNGAGVPPEIEQKLFERFVHNGRDALLSGSVGLGLAIARSLVESMSGSLTYHRSDGETGFIIKVPAVLYAVGEVPSRSVFEPGFSA